jgi:carboxymethylenebutenolidase
MCYDDKAQPPVPEAARQSATLHEEHLKSDDNSPLMVALALPEQPGASAVVILPDVRGLHGFYRELALRFAELGIAAIAIDYFGRTAASDARDESFEFMPHVQQLRFDNVVADMRVALARLRDAAPSTTKVFTVGFCLGGTLSFLSGTTDLPLQGLVGFYSGMTRDLGAGTLLDRATEIRRPALGLFGGADQGIPPEKVNAFETALQQAGVAHEIVTYDGAPHSFFDRHQAQYAEASADAWRRVLAFIKQQG